MATIVGSNGANATKRKPKAKPAASEAKGQ